MKRSFGEILEALMKDKNLSIRALAKELSLPHKTLSEWIGPNGRMPRKPEHLDKLAGYFNCTVHYLLYGTEDPRGLLGNILRKTEVHSGLYQITIEKVDAPPGGKTKEEK